ncbi:MAG: NAD(P)-dependent oxidoreductase [Bacteroidales bacterium]|nr:NAD(P)-dependent oxidoreductase [Bacteroidales bacterium]
MAKKILITGAGGFVGGFIVEAALNRGYETWAAVRATTSLEYLTDPRINIIELCFTDTNILREQLSLFIAENGKWDYIIHNLGATKCNNFREFNRINCDYLKDFANLLIETGCVPDKFLLMSSLSVMGQGDDNNYTPFSTSDIPHPNTQYGVSKLMGEQAIKYLPKFPYVIFRATGVYGPHEKDYFLMMKSIAQGFDFSVGFKKQMLTFIYVKDLAEAMMDALEAPAAMRKTYFIAEKRGYTQKEFREIVANALGKKYVLPICAPLWLTRIICWISEKIGILRMKPSTLNTDKFKIIKQRNWLCDVSDSERDFNFSPKYDLEAGVKEAIAWYRQVGWLK